MDWTDGAQETCVAAEVLKTLCSDLPNFSIYCVTVRNRHADVKCIFSYLFVINKKLEMPGGMNVNICTRKKWKMHNVNCICVQTE